VTSTQSHIHISTHHLKFFIINHKREKTRLTFNKVEREREREMYNAWLYVILTVLFHPQMP
jgi:hypothetical protein